MFILSFASIYLKAKAQQHHNAYEILYVYSSCNNEHDSVDQCTNPFANCCCLCESNAMLSFCLTNEFITLNSQHGSEQRCHIADDLLPLWGRTSLLMLMTRWIDRGVFDGSLLQTERSARCVVCGGAND